MLLKSKYFYGNEVSERGIKYGYVDYYTFFKAFGRVRNNDIMENTKGIGEWEQISGGYHEDEYQYYIVDQNGARLIQEEDMVLYYNETLDLFVWAITHYGTAWEDVLTNIKIEREEEDDG